MSRNTFLAVPVAAIAAATMIVPAHSWNNQSAQATVAEAEAAAKAMESSWNIVQNTTNSPEHQTLVKAIVRAKLVETLSGPGPFTVFAPTDQAFAAVPAPMTQYLMADGNEPVLAQLLKYHVVPGQITSTNLYAKIKAGGGKAELKTVEGQKLTFTEVQGNIKVNGTQGSSGYVTQADVSQSNGVVHVLNGVLVPKFKAVAKPKKPAAAAPAPDTATPTGAGVEAPSS